MEIADLYRMFGSFDYFKGTVLIRTNSILPVCKLAKEALEKHKIHSNIVKKDGKYYLYIARKEAWKFFTLIEKSIECPSDYMTLQKDKKGKSIAEDKPGREMIVENLKCFYQNNPGYGFRILKYQVWEESYSIKTIERFFGSIQAALLQSEVPSNFI